MQGLYRKCHIFPQVGYGTVTTSILEAMSYDIPVVVLNLFNNSELIQHGKNGMLINVSDTEGFYSKHELPNEHSKKFENAMLRSRLEITDRLTESLRLFIEDKTLRNKIVYHAKKL